MATTLVDSRRVRIAFKCQEVDAPSAGGRAFCTDDPGKSLCFTSFTEDGEDVGSRPDVLSRQSVRHSLVHRFAYDVLYM